MEGEHLFAALFVGCCNLLVAEHLGLVELAGDIEQFGSDFEQAVNINRIEYSCLIY